MCFNGVWGAVCASGWNDIAANIVCKQLGYTSSSELKKMCMVSCWLLSLPINVGVPLRWENSPTLFNNIGCNETHSMLFQCIDVHNIGVYDCSVNNTAGVICEMPSPDNTISLPMITSVSACIWIN